MNAASFPTTNPNPARVSGPAKSVAEPLIPHPPLFVRSGGFWSMPTGIVRLRGTVALAWDVRAETLSMTGKIRIFPLIPWRVAFFIGAVAMASLVGGFVAGEWITRFFTAPVEATATTALTSSNAIVYGICTAVGAFAAMLPTWFVMWLLLTIDVPRFDVPALALRGAMADGRELVLHMVPHVRWHLVVLTEQERALGQLVDIVNRVAGVVADVQRELAAGGDWTALAVPDLPPPKPVE